MLSGLKVLIVEDEPIIAFALEDILESLGCEEVVVATHLLDAQRELGAGRFDAAVLDVNIHGERSHGIADTLAERSVPFIFATGYGDTQHSSRHAGVPTLTKPYTLDEVREALSSALQGRA